MNPVPEPDTTLLANRKPDDSANADEVDFMRMDNTDLPDTQGPAA